MILSQAKAGQRQLPKSIKEAPELLTGLELYWNGFWDLLGCRQMGFGAFGPIPWTAVRHYCEANDLSEDQTEDMHHHITKMGAALATHNEKEQDRQNKRKK